jgi:hypothetical protein
VNSKKPVGPIDVNQWLADRAAKKAPPRSDSIEVFLAPELAVEYDALVDQYDALVEDSERPPAVDELMVQAPADHSAELDELEQRMDAILAEAESTKVTLTFRSYEVGDNEAIAAEQKARGIQDNQSDHIAVLRTAQFSLEPKLSVDEVTELVKAIGYSQFNAVCAVWLKLAYGQATAPKLRKPLRTRGTTKL